jgi:hypothetical protein
MDNINRILISVDDNPLYIQFLPIFSLACQKVIGVKPTLAYVTDKKENEWQWMKEYCQDIIRVPIVKELPDGKCRTFFARMILRYKFESDICMIGDIDLLPLNEEYFKDIMKVFSRDKFLSSGYNVFEFGDGDPKSQIHDPKLRKFPSCYTIATGKVWKEIINPLNLSDEELMKSWFNLKEFDDKESVNNPNFCDESLMRLLIQRWNSSRDRIIGIDRAICGGRIIDRIDRSHWRINYEKLIQNEYVDAHCPRPLSSNKDIKLLTDYLQIPFIVGKL